MADRVYPSSKPTTNPHHTLNGNGTATTAPSFPATKAQLYGATRPAYRPQPRPRRRRSCCYTCCLWTTLLLLSLLLLAAITGAIFWVLYRPHRPTFSVSSLKLSQFNLTSSSQLNSKLNLTISARNTNKKLVFYYDPITISVTSDGVDVGDGSLRGFVHGTKNTTTLKAVIASSTGQSLDSTSVTILKSNLKNKNSLPLKLRLDTKVRVKVSGFKTNKVGIRVSCDGIKAAVPTGKSSATATTADAKCKVDLRIKVWKWTF